MRGSFFFEDPFQWGWEESFKYSGLNADYKRPKPDRLESPEIARIFPRCPLAKASTHGTDNSLRFFFTFE